MKKITLSDLSDQFDFAAINFKIKTSDLFLKKPDIDLFQLIFAI